ncbi:MAG: CapA family protein [Bacteroidales bacterium]|nr:CapA family protein [Bacteroidales bacterium]MDD4210478.1 CapA family protein [Bacteroidales bacterium]
MLCAHFVWAQDTTLSILFLGDIMGHDGQIKAAFNEKDSTYDYTINYASVKEICELSDITIANLEVTLAGKPYKGYPAFSSPDEVVFASIDAGIDCFITANNHSCDRGKHGILRTLNVLDSLEIVHTGTFRNLDERHTKYPLKIEQNGISIALLNYTYGTNGIAVPSPTIVNLINKDSIKADLNKAKAMNVDKIIVCLHWGIEYQRQPNQSQIDLYDFCKENGADIIIGGHPHVIQKMEWEEDKLVAYSLGNFISNQRKQYTDGGAMLRIELEKINGIVQIKDAGYYLTWVYKPWVENKQVFKVLAVSKYENMPDFFESEEPKIKMDIFKTDARNLLNSENKNIKEYKYNPETQCWE